MAALDLPRLSLAALRGMTVAVITAPLSAGIANALHPHLERLPVFTPWPPGQLVGAVWLVATLGAASWLAHRPAQALPRGELVAALSLLTAVLGFLAGGVVGPHAFRFALTCCGALLGGALAGGLLWRGDAFAGAGLGAAAALTGVVGALAGAVVIGGPVTLTAGLNGLRGPVSSAEAAVVSGGLATVSLVCGFLAAHRMGHELAAADPLLAHSVLDRPRQRSA